MPTSSSASVLAQPPLHGVDGTTVGAHQFLRFALGSERYAVRIDAVREILEVARMTPLPLMPGFVLGVMNLRGAVVPVVDLGARLGLPAANVSRRSCVVIVDIANRPDEGPHRLGMLVDSVYEVVDATDEELETVPRLGTRIDGTLIRSMVRIRDQVTPELDIGQILDPTTLSALIAEYRPAH